MAVSFEDKDRSCDVALMKNGQIVFLIELSPDSKEDVNRNKNFVYVYKSRRADELNNSIS